MDYAHKGMLTAAKAIALSAIDVFESPQVVIQAKAELKDRLDGQRYACPIPENVIPNMGK